MFISYTDKIVYVATPKTGTRSIKRFLQENYNAEIMAEHGRILPPEAKHFFCFTTVRNPYDRAVSIWWSTCKRGKNKKYQNLIDKGLDQDFSLFMEYILNTMNKYQNVPKNLYPLALPQHVFLKPVEAFIDRYCKMENLDEEIKSLPFVKSDSPGLKHLNQTIDTRQSWEKYATDSSIEMINEWAGKDFEYGYESI